jgi:glucosylglycerate phosphorylase
MSFFNTTQLTELYGAVEAAGVELRLQELAERYRGKITLPVDSSLTERDSVLITYADQVRVSGQMPIQTLARFCATHLRGVVSGIHILPFYPWSSDDGFSVKDHHRVDPALGDWQDIEDLGKSFRLMFDGVINHASTRGSWFQSFLHNEIPYRDYFLTVEGNPDLAGVVRPRNQPLLTGFQTSAGLRQVWTTFGSDQADLDYHNPEVMLDIFDVLLDCARHGAQFIRLDAIAYLWKEIGTPCINLPQVHAFVQLLRTLLDDVAPHVRLITETNVDHAANVSYFGDGQNEAQMVYNFALPPLVLHTFRLGDASILSNWATRLDLPSERTTYLNFLASHDGIGLNPVQDLLSPFEIQALVDQTLAQGGLISYKQTATGAASPYELNINYFDALSNPSKEEPLETCVARFITAQAIMLSIQGVPGIYFHSLFGSRNWAEGVQSAGYKRAINRQKLELSDLERKLADPTSLQSLVYDRFRRLLSIRCGSAAFHPNGRQEILDAGPGVFTVLRTSPGSDRRALCLHNVTAQAHSVSILNTSRVLKPYQTLWVLDP